MRRRPATPVDADAGRSRLVAVARLVVDDHRQDGAASSRKPACLLPGRAYTKRHETEPPKWMSGLEKERPKGAFLLGLAPALAGRLIPR
jgi:hypothetical protein